MEDRAVTAEADQKIRVAQLLRQIVQDDILRKLKVLVHIKGKADPGFNARLMQDLFRQIGVFEIAVPIGIRGHDYFFHTFSFSWAAVTSAAVSGITAPSGSMDR